MRILPTLLFAACVLTAIPALADQPAEAGIHETLQKCVAAFNAGDADAAAATYTADASHTYALGFTHHGRAEIARGLRELLSGPMKGARLSITSLKIRLLEPNVAIEEESFSVEGLKSPAGEAIPAVNGLCLAVYHREKEQWLAAAVQCMVPPTRTQT